MASFSSSTFSCSSSRLVHRNQFDNNMLSRFWSTVIVGSLFCFFSLYDCHTDGVAADRYVDNYSVVDLPEVKEEAPEPESKPHRRLKRSSWSLPPNTSTRLVLDLILPIAPLNNTFSSLVLDLIYRFVLPTYTQLDTLYSSLGRLDEDGQIEGETSDSNVIDYEFFEEQRANRERRAIYQQAESLFETFGFDGQTCLLRAICEMAEAPLIHHGLAGKLIDLIFTPNLVQVPKAMEPYLSGNRIRRDATNVPELEVLQIPVEDDYTDAYRAGKEGKCWARYFACPVSLFKLVGFSK